MAKKQETNTEPRRVWSDIPNKPDIPNRHKWEKQAESETFLGMEISYLVERMWTGNEEEGVQPIKLSEEENLFCVKRFGGKEWQWREIFTMDDNETSVGLERDGICIMITDLDRNLIEYEEVNVEGVKTGMVLPYQITRCSEYYYRTKEHPHGNSKYYMPSAKDGANHPYPFLPPILIENWESGANIDTLVLTDSCINAQILCMQGLMTIGFGNWFTFQNRQDTEMYRDVLRLITDCNVKNVVVLLDGDCRDISMQDLKDGKELVTRPRANMELLKRIRKQLKNCKDLGLWLAYLKSQELPSNPTTVDKVILGNDNANEVIEDLRNVEKPSGYFKKMSFRKTDDALSDEFKLSGVDEFYRVWKDVIGTQKFTYYNTIYQWNEVKGQLITCLSDSLKDFYFIGDNFYEKMYYPNPRKADNPRIVLEKRQKETIKLRFSKVCKDPLQQIADCNGYLGFCVYPDNKNYVQSINGMYNTWSPLPYKAEDGACPHILWMMHHLFQEQYEYGMDYVQLLIENPIQLLPILCFVSAERGTGKSTFLHFLCELLGNNAVTVGSRELKSQFNGMFMGKLVVGCDETQLSDTPEFTERLKYWSTAPQISVEKKGVDAIMVDNFIKIVLVSNDETGFLYTSDKEVRFWVIKVNTIPDNQKIPDIMPYIRDEIPAFLAYLADRKLYQPESLDRMYFRPEDIETEATRKLKEQNRPKPLRLIRSWMHDFFCTARKYNNIKLTIKMLMENVEGLSVAVHGDAETLKRYLEDPKFMNMSTYIKPNKRKAENTYCSFDKPVLRRKDGTEDETEIYKWETVSHSGMAYQFFAKDFLTSEEMEIYNIPVYF